MNKRSKKQIMMSDSPVNSSGGKLATLWRKIIRHYNATDKVDDMLTRYKTTIPLDNASKALSSISGLEKSAYADTLTLKRFVNLIRKLLWVSDFEITITIKPKNGTVSQHAVSFKYEEEEEEEGEHDE